MVKAADDDSVTEGAEIDEVVAHFFSVCRGFAAAQPLVYAAVNGIEKFCRESGVVALCCLVLDEVFFDVSCDSGESVDKEGVG